MDQKLPYYMAYPTPLLYDDERRERMDFEYMKSMYPDAAKQLVPYIEDECDRVAYEGSVMFDEYPDKYTLQAICRTIYRKVNDLEELKGTSCCKDPVYQMIEVMLLNEIYKRRCRYRRCRRRYW